MPHFGHAVVLRIVEVKAKALTTVVIGMRAISSRSGVGRCVAYGRVVGVWVAAHTVSEIDPGEPANMNFLLAFESTQTAPQSFWLKEFASRNMLSI